MCMLNTSGSISVNEAVRSAERLRIMPAGVSDNPPPASRLFLPKHKVGSDFKLKGEVGNIRPGALPATPELNWRLKLKCVINMKPSCHLTRETPMWDFILDFALHWGFYFENSSCRH